MTDNIMYMPNGQGCIQEFILGGGGNSGARGVWGHANPGNFVFRLSETASGAFSGE